MTQNTTHAVMQQRSEALDSLDDFPTPPWATRAVIEKITEPALNSSTRASLLCHSTVWEPACNRGYMVRGLDGYFAAIARSDIHDYGVGAVQHDFLMPFQPFAGVIDEFDWIITNPPFRLAEQFVKRALDVARLGVAIIVRSAFLEGAERYESLFRDRPPSIVAQHVERVIMTKGIVRDPSKEYWDEAAQKMRRPSTATSYCWLIWLRDWPVATTMRWIPPCRKSMERSGDYHTS